MRRFGHFVVSLFLMSSVAAFAQQTPPPPAVGVAKAEMKPITQKAEYLGRIQAVQRVAINPG